jgi:ankyrin repeat protein
LVKWFLFHGATLNFEFNEYTCRTPFTYAVGCVSLKMVKLLVAHGAKLDHGNLLHKIVESNYPGRLEILDYLVKQGADVDQIEKAFNYRLFDVEKEAFGIGTALHNVVKHNNLAVQWRC